MSLKTNDISTILRLVLVVISFVLLHGNSLVVLVGVDEAVDGLWLRFVAVSGLRWLVADRLLVDRLVADDGLRLMGHRLVANDSFDEKLGQIFESIIISSIG